MRTERLLLVVPICLGLALVAQGQSDLLDVSFGGDGIVTSDIGYYHSSASAIVQQADGSLVVAGDVTDTVNDNSIGFLVARYLPDGTLDPSFNGTGYRTTHIDSISFSPYDIFNAVAVQQDGKIIAGGQTREDAFSSSYVLLRYLPDGTPDPSFGQNGLVVTDDVELNGQVHEVLVQADGRIVAVGGTGDGFALMRYDEQGNPDADFGANGLAYFPMPWLEGFAFDGALMPDGRIVAVGCRRWSDYLNVHVVMVQPDGDRDSTFSADGEVNIRIDTLGGSEDIGTAVCPAADGKILVAGTNRVDNDERHLFVLRLMPNGLRDQSFGTNGVVGIPADLYYGALADMTVTPDDHILVAAFTTNGTDYDFMLTRITPDGDLDPSFGNNGTLLTDIAGGATDIGHGVVIQADGKVAVCGTYYNGSGTQIALVRYAAADVGMDHTPLPATEFLVQPNPASTIAHIQFELAHAGSIACTVVDASGRRVREVFRHRPFTQGIQRVDLGVGDLEEGIYSVILTNDGYVASTPLVVVR